MIIILPDMTSLAENLKRWRAKKLKIERINANTLYIKTLCRQAKSVVDFVRFDSGTGVNYCIFHVRGMDTGSPKLPHNLEKQIIEHISVTKRTLPLKQRARLLEEQKKYWVTHPFQSIEDSIHIESKLYDDGWGTPSHPAIKGNTKNKRDRILKCMAELL